MTACRRSSQLRAFMVLLACACGAPELTFLEGEVGADAGQSDLEHVEASRADVSSEAEDSSPGQVEAADVTNADQTDGWAEARGYEEEPSESGKPGRRDASKPELNHPE